MRQFEFSDTKSHKFWHIDVTGTSYTVTYGKIGTAGQTKTKSYSTEEACQAEAEKLIKEKTGKGYTEVTPRTVKSDREAIEENLLAHPEDRTAFAAYADLLQEEGEDARAELIRVQMELEDESLAESRRTELQAREKELLDAHQREWLGGLAPTFLDQEIHDYMRENPQYLSRPIWRRGCLMGLHFAGFGVTIARALRDSADRLPLLRELSIQSTAYEEAGDEYEDGPDIPTDVATDFPSIALLTRFPRLKQLRTFRLGEDDSEEEYFNCHSDGELAHHLVKQMPHLEELELFAHRVVAQTLFAFPMPNLRVLKLYHSASYPLRRLAENKTLTNLATLMCHPHAIEDEEDGYDLDNVRALARSKHLPNLKHLRLRIFQPGDEGVRAIVEAGMLERLKVLDLAIGPITDVGAELLANSPHIKNLETLDLSQNALTDVGISRLQETGVNLVADTQHGDDDENWMYQGDIE